MTLTTWLRAVLHRRQSPPTCHRNASTIELGLARLEDRRVLSVSGGEVMLFSIGGGGATLPGDLTVESSDVVSYDGSQFAIVFDGSDVGVEGASIDALAWKGDNQLLVSFLSDTTIGGVTYDTNDILLFEADSLGENTSGTFSLFLSGSSLGLNSPAGNINSLDYLEDGSLVFSTVGNVTLPVGPNGQLVAVQNEDLVQLTPDASGSYASGTWQLYSDGTGMELASSFEQIDAVAVDGAQIHLSTVGTFFIHSQSLGGSREDVITYNASTLGENTTGAYVGLTFDGNLEVGFGFDLSALEFATLPPQNNLPTAGNVSLSANEDSPVQGQLLGDDGDEALDQPLTYHIVDGPDFGVITEFDPSTGAFTYLPNAEFSGSDQFIYVVHETDANGTVFTSELATVAITVTAVNDAPVVHVAQPEFTGTQGTPVVIQGLAVDDIEAASNLQQISVTLQLQNGTLSVSDGVSSVVVSGNGTGQVQLTGTLTDINLLLSQGVTAQTAETFSGTATVNVTIQDGLDPNDSLTATGSVQLNIIAPEPPPPPPEPEPPVSLQDRIQELLENGELRRNQAQVLLNVLKHPNNERLIENALRKIDHWEDRGKLDSDLAEELTERLEDMLDEAQNDRPGNSGIHQALDKLFAKVGLGKLKLAVGKFR